MKHIELIINPDRFIPNHTIELLLSEHRYLREKILGVFSKGQWCFSFSVPQKLKNLHFKFLLDGKYESETSFELNIEFRDKHKETYEESQLGFTEEYEARLRHGINNLLTEENYYTRKYVKSNYDEDKIYDVIVIGSGMGGGILADALSDLEADVLVLEAGTVHQPVNVYNLPTANDVFASQTYYNLNNSVLEKDVCLNLGGRSIYWSALIPRMDSWESQFWPQEVRDYLFDREGYDKAEVLFRKRTNYNSFQENLLKQVEAQFGDFFVTHLPRSFHQHMSRITRREGFPDERPTGVFSTAALLLNSLSEPGKFGAEKLTINLNHLVTKIEEDQKGKKVSAVVCYDLISNINRTYKAKAVVLCAGATESPIIFMRSELKDYSNNVGKGATDHQSADFSFDIPTDSPYISENDQAKLFLKPKSFNESMGFYTCELTLNEKFWDVRYEDDDLFQSKLRPGSMGKVKFLFRRGLDEENYVCAGEPLNKVYVKPMTDKPFEQECKDLKNRVLRFFGINDRELLEQGLAYRQSSETYHLGGTLRMGKHHSECNSSPVEVGVVDSNLKFHEYDNLYCCDLSVFPDIPTANPSLTLGALAMRLAKHIKENHKL